MTKKRFITVKDIITDQHFCIDCENPINCFKVAQHFHKQGEYRYRQIRFRSQPSPKKLGYILLKFDQVLKVQ
jgi:hypothetical protein